MPAFTQQALLASYKAISDLAGKAAFFAILLVAARVVSIDVFGLFSLATTLGWILSVATDFGLQVYAAKAIAQAPASMATILPPILRLRAGLAAAAAVLALLLPFAALPPGDALAFAGIVIAYLASAMVEFLNYVYRAVARSELESTLNLVQRVSTLALALLLLWWSPTLASLAIALLVPAAVTLAVSAGLLRRIGFATPEISGSLPPVPARPGTQATSAPWRAAVPLGVGITLSALYFRLDLFLIEYWLSLDDVAYYNAVFRLVDALRLFPAAILAVVLPVVFKQPSARFVWRLSAGLAVMGLLIALAVYPAAAWILDLAYGERYLAGVDPFRVLLFGFPLLAFNYALTHAVIGWGGERTFAAGCAAGLVTNLALNAALIPGAGTTGAAWATVLTELFLTAVWLAVLVRRRPSPGVQSPAS